MADHPETLLEFPCTFPIKIMGPLQDDFATAMTALVLRHAPDFDPATLTMRPSSNHKYLALTFTIRATSKDQLDAIYSEVSAHPMVLMAL